MTVETQPACDERSLHQFAALGLQAGLLRNAQGSAKLLGETVQLWTRHSCTLPLTIAARQKTTIHLIRALDSPQPRLGILLIFYAPTKHADMAITGLHTPGSDPQTAGCPRLQRDQDSLYDHTPHIPMTV